MKTKLLSISTILLMIVGGVILAFGGTVGTGWAAAAANESARRDAPLDWQQVFPEPFPVPRSLHAAAYDSDRGVTVLFGGYGKGGRYNDTWEWDGSEWVQRFPANTPPDLVRAAMAYDSVRKVCVLFGGFSGNYSNATWEWDGVNWTQIFPDISPSRRADHGMVFDSTRGVTVLFGGTPGSGSLDDTWEWDGVNWSLRSPENKPPKRENHAMAYDSGRQVTVLFGGRQISPTIIGYNDTWEWDGVNWSLKTPQHDPGAQSSHGMVYDSVRKVTVFFGNPANKTVWGWDGVDWSQSSTNNGPKEWRVCYSLTYDHARDTILLFGGQRTYWVGSSLVYVFYAETWEFGAMSDPEPTPTKVSTPDPTPDPTPNPTPEPGVQKIYLPLVVR